MRLCRPANRRAATATFNDGPRSTTTSTIASVMRTPSLPTLRLFPSRYTLRARREQQAASAAPYSMPNVVELLTPEVWRLILRHLDGRTAVRVSRVSRYFRPLIADDQELWRHLYLRAYALHDDTEKELLRWTIAHSDDRLAGPRSSSAAATDQPPSPLSASDADRVVLRWPADVPDEALPATQGNWRRRFARRARLEWCWRHQVFVRRQLNLADSASRQLRARPIAAGAWGTLLCLQDNDRGQGQLLFILVPTEPMPLPSHQHQCHHAPSVPPKLLLLDGPPFGDLDQPLINGRFIATCGTIQPDNPSESHTPARCLIVWRIGHAAPVYRADVQTYAQVVDLRDAWLLLRERADATDAWQYTMHHLEGRHAVSQPFTASFGCHIQRATTTSAVLFHARLLDAATTVASHDGNAASIVSWTDKGQCAWRLLRFALSPADTPNITVQPSGESGRLTVVGRAGHYQGRRRTLRHGDHRAALVELGMSADDNTALEVTLLDLRQCRMLRRERFTSAACTAGMAAAATAAAAYSHLGPDGNDAMLDVSPWQLAPPLRSPPMHLVFSRGVIDRRYRPPLAMDDPAVQLHRRLLGRLHVHYEHPMSHASHPVEHVTALCIYDAHTVQASLSDDMFMPGSGSGSHHGAEASASFSYGYYPQQPSAGDVPRRVGRLLLPSHVLLRHLVTSCVHVAYLQPEYALLQIIQFA
ncbi:hypothetical protein SYNPS1DRAFT_26730 [Syncephalis pseudoplumigaleata]|uniref:F-box domain-containing protein n=1 Tax=Syncephalis pseudoplumigaleata TaxID=1712513 RepID=A0A4P9Z7E7_9FUNG|nr:hypothetical protein SYNPS1DRAFT_26730 [Syncephalis pseudoplumigaleata]|eukprot:RKP27630.1 hypothetical protein SYNPS1DRAFT_26730 [Syncephalis pseudoplumigaleata]